MTITEILIGIASNLGTACAQEVASRVYDKAASAGLDMQRWQQRAKALETRVVESFSAVARNLPYAPTKLDKLRAVLSDQVFVSDVAGALVAGDLSPDWFASQLQQREVSLSDDVGLREFAAALTEAFNAALAVDAELVALVGLRRSEALKHQVENVSSTVVDVSRGMLDLTIQSARDQDEIRATLRELRSTVVEGFGRRENRPVLLEEGPVSVRLKQSIKRRFEDALIQLKTGSAATAARELQSLIADLKPEDPDEKHLHFRAIANLGVAFHYLGDANKASEYLDRAYELDPSSIRATANKVLSLLNRKDYRAAERLLDDALRADPNDVDLINFKAQLLSEEGDDKAAVDFLETRLRPNESLFVSLSIYQSRTAQYRKAAEAARKALELNPKSDPAMAVLADALAMPIVFRKGEHKLPGYALSRSECEALREAIKLDERAVKMLRCTDHRAALAQLLINFSAYLTAAGEFKRAVMAAEEAIEMLPNDGAPLANLYMAQMHLARFIDAADTARRLVHVEDPVIATMREMDALMGQRDFPTVIQLYSSRCIELPSLLNEPHAVCVYASALFKSFDTESAIKELERASERFPNHTLVLLEQGQLYEELHDYDKAEVKFGKAVQHAVGPYAFHARQQLGLFHYRRGNWAEAERNLLAGIEDPLVSPFVIQYLISLYQLGRYKECLSLANAVIESGAFNETVWELATNCHLNFQDLEAAEHLLEQLVRQSDELRHWLKLFQVAFRLHDVDRAGSVLKRAYAKHPDSFDVVVNLSGIEFMAGNYRRAFELALRAVELKPDHAEGHRAVIRCGLMGPDSQKFSNAEKKKIQTSIAKLAGQEDSGLRPMEIKQDLSNLIEIMRQSSETAGKAEQLFSTKGLPMSFLSRVLGRSPFKIWSGLISHHRLFVPMATGLQEEQTSETNLAMTCGEVTVDITALFTLKMLELLHLLPKVFSRIYVATATFESIKQELDEVTAFKAPTGILGYSDGKLVMADVSVEVYERRKAFLTDVLVFLRSDSVSLSGIEGSWDDKRIHETINALGDQTGHSIAVAKGKKLSLFSDDVGVRVLAKREHQVSGFCTQAFLRSAVAKGLLPVDSYEDALLLLFANNYNFVSESAETVFRALRKDSYAITPLTKRLVSRIAETGINRKVTAGILGHALADIWLRAGRLLREQWIDLAVENIGAEDFAEISAAILQSAGVSLWRLPGMLFGLSNAILASSTFSAEQKRVWKILCFLTANALEKACSSGIVANEPVLRAEWHEHIRASQLLDNINSS